MDCKLKKSLSLLPMLKLKRKDGIFLIRNALNAKQVAEDLRIPCMFASLKDGDGNNCRHKLDGEMSRHNYTIRLVKNLVSH